MKADHSPAMRQAKHEMKMILEKYNIAGVVLLADGEGMGEFGAFLETPTWSGISANDYGFRIQMNNKSPENHKKADMTTNACVILRDMLGLQFQMINALVQKIEEHVKIETTSETKITREGNYLQ